MFEVFFDVETKKFFDETGDFDPAKLGVSIVSLYFREVNPTFQEIKGEMRSFWEDEFDKMWALFRQADRIIGFNSIRFDVRALEPYAPKEFSKLPHFDILEKIKDESGRRASLDRVAKDTLGVGKIDKGENAGVYWKKGDKESLSKLRKYCEADVDLTKRVYDFGKINGFIKYTDFWNNLRTVPVDFSYPEGFAPTAKQTSLF